MTPAILVVDDEPLLATILAVFLEEEGFLVRTARNGVEALVAHDQAPADLILSDVMMPILDGLTLVSDLRLRDDPTPVVLMSAESGWVDLPVDVLFVAKPFDLDELLSAVVQELSRLVAETHGGNPAA